MTPRGTSAALAVSDAQALWRRRALLESIRHSDAAVVRALLELGAPVAACDSDGFAPLVVAAQLGEVDAMSVLVEAGADVDARDTGKRNWPPLMHALFADQRDAALALLAWGADPNVAEETGFDALMMAASRGDALIVQTLLEKGADPTNELFLGFTAVDYAIGYGHIESARVLLAAAPGLKQRANAARRAVLALARNGDDEDLLALLE